MSTSQQPQWPVATPDTKGIHSWPSGTGKASQMHEGILFIYFSPPCNNHSICDVILLEIIT